MSVADRFTLTSKALCRNTGRGCGVPTHHLHGVHSPECGAADAGIVVGEARVGVDQSGFDLEGGRCVHAMAMDDVPNL